jgi:anti-sigma factor RsiW
MARKRGRAKRQPTDRDLQAYVDGELDAARRVEVSEALDRDPALRATVKRYEAQRRALRRLYRPALDEPIPDELARLVRKGHKSRLH